MAYRGEHAIGDIGHVIRSTLGVSVGVVLFGLANGGLFALIGVRLPEAGASDALVGLVSSAYFLGTLTASLTGGWLVARLNHVRSFTLFAVVAGLSTVALAVSSSELAWPILRYLTGCGIGGYYVVVESWFNHASRNEGRGRSLAYYETVRLASVAAGSLVFLNIGNLVPVGPFALAGMLYVAAILPVMLNARTRPHIERRTRLGLKAIAAAAPLGVWCCVVGGLVTGAIYGLVPLYGAKLGLGAVEVSVFVFVNHFAALLVQYPVGWLSDRYGRRRAIVGITLLLTAAAVSLAVVEKPSLGRLLAASVVIGGVGHTLHTVGVVYANDRLDPSAVVHAAATLLVAYDVGTSVGPFIASLAMTAVGPAGLYWFMAAFAASVAAFALIGQIRFTRPANL